MTESGPVARLRMPRSALVAVVVLVACTIPLASVSRWLLLLFVLPAAVGAYVWRSGADVSSAGVLVRATLGSTWVPWERVAGLETRRRGELWLVRKDGTAVRVPVLRSPRDLPRLHEASAGRLGLAAES